MPISLSDPAESLVRHSHRSLGLALIVLLTLFCWAIAINVFPSVAAVMLSRRLPFMLPVFIAIAVATLCVAQRPTFRLQLKLILADELRQSSLHRAWRNGFISMFLAQPVLVAALIWHPVGAVTVAVLMAAVTFALGAMTVLASVLFYDR
jgi:hypothetical protein